MCRRDAWALTVGLGLCATGASGCRDDQPPIDETSDTDGSETGEETGEETGIDETGVDETGEPPPEVAVPLPGGLRRLLSSQYVASIDYLLGPEAAAATIVPDDPSLGAFDSLATITSVPSVIDIEDYEDSSRAVAGTVVANPTRLAEFAPCVVDGPFDDGCYESIARDFGHVAWRRPLTDEQVDLLVDVARGGREQGGDEFMSGVELMLTAVLQSPYFLYLVEVGEPGEEFRELTGAELATRMAFFLTDRTPTLDLLNRAESGELDSDEGVRAVAEELIAQPQARNVVSRFFGELLTVRKLPTKGKNEELFPTFSEELAASMFEETQRLVEEVVFTDNTSVMRLFDADHTFVDDSLAELYGMDPVGGSWARVPLPAGRAGVLSLSGWLTMQSHGRVNSPTRRGTYVLERLMCRHLGTPPPDVNPEPIEVEEGLTLRESLTQRVANADCQICHGLTDPIGFGFEHFNPIGAWQDTDNGQPIDASGTLFGAGDFDGADELAVLLAEDPSVARCMVDNVFAAQLGVIPKADQALALDDVGDTFEDADHNFQSLMVELTTSPIFRLVDEPR